MTPATSEKRVLCIACHQERQIKSQSPGVIQYSRCSCGEIGVEIHRAGIQEQPTPHVKKSFRKVYWER